MMAAGTIVISTPALVWLSWMSYGSANMLLSTLKSGDEIILPRNVHQSVINALVLCGAVPVYVNPETDRRLGIALGMAMKWVNFGGGHHITRADYDRDALVRCVRRFREKYGIDVYLEPGEAVALNAGSLFATVLDVVENDMQIAILDASAACHMPDVIEMPYRPPLAGAGQPGEKPYTYRLAGGTCLAGDVIGDYSFDAPLAVGTRLQFDDMPTPK